MGNYVIDSALTGTGTLEKAGAGTLFFGSSATTAGFSGRLRVSSSASGQQSSVRITTNTIGGTSIFGTSTTTNAAAPIDMRGGVLEFRNDASLTYSKETFFNNSSTIYVGPGVGGAGINGTATFSNIRLAQGVTATFSSRNGFGATYSNWTQESTNGDNAIANNMGGNLIFTGTAWNNTNNTADRTLTFSGNGNTVIEGISSRAVPRL